jgi:hypothetical protein
VQNALSPFYLAVCSGYLTTMQARVEAGADSGRRETVWHGLLGWAEYHLGARTDGESQQRYGEIAP